MGIDVSTSIKRSVSRLLPVQVILLNLFGARVFSAVIEEGKISTPQMFLFEVDAHTRGRPIVTSEQRPGDASIIIEAKDLAIGGDFLMPQWSV